MNKDNNSKEENSNTEEEDDRIELVMTAKTSPSGLGRYYNFRLYYETDKVLPAPTASEVDSVDHEMIKLAYAGFLKKIYKPLVEVLTKKKGGNVDVKKHAFSIKEIIQASLECDVLKLAIGETESDTILWDLVDKEARAMMEDQGINAPAPKTVQ